MSFRHGFAPKMNDTYRAAVPTLAMPVSRTPYLPPPERTSMKFTILMTAVLLTAGLATTAGAQTVPTLKKVADSNKITVSYREASVPFSYLIGSKTSVGFSAELTEAIIDDVRKKVKKPNLEVSYMPVTSQNRIPLLVNGTYDL